MSSMKKTKRSFILFLSFLLSFLCGCASLTGTNSSSFNDTQNARIISAEIEWQKLNEACDYFLFSDKTIPLKWHCVKIDLSCTKLQLTTFPSEQKILKNGLKLKNFAKDTESFICVNTSPFTKTGSGKKTLAGIHKADGKVFSPPQKKYSALALKKETNGSLKAFVLENQDKQILEDFDYAFGGFFTILLDGHKKEFSYESKDSRTAIGTSKDGKTLFILVVEGEFPFKSCGLSYPDCALILQNLGASDALEMDGGSSSALFINCKNALSYPAMWKGAAFIGFKMSNN